MINNASNTTVPLGEQILTSNSYSVALNCAMNEVAIHRKDDSELVLYIA